jgi:hypothetical protein
MVYARFFEAGADLRVGNILQRGQSAYTDLRCPLANPTYGLPTAGTNSARGL